MASFLDDILGSFGTNTEALFDVLGPMAVQAGIQTLFPGLTETQRAMAGFQGEIPNYEVRRQRVPGTNDPNRRPGSSGQRYFTDVEYVSPGQGTPPALDPVALAAANLANPNRETRSRTPIIDANYPFSREFAPLRRASVPSPVTLAAGGIASLKPGQYFSGNTDGMADRVPAVIDGVQPAALSDGEFVFPSDVVADIGNGNSNAGARELKELMDRIRKARHGNKSQGKQIDARKMLGAIG
jgi:hypothetical protein